MMICALLAVGVPSAFADTDPSIDISVNKPTEKLFYYTGEEITAYESCAAYTVFGEKSAVNSGTYTVTVVLNDGYKWSDGTYDSLMLSWVITADDQVERPSSKSFTYIGKTITAYEDCDAYTFSGTTSAKDAGTYSICATLNSGYRWNDGSTEAFTFTWTIQRQSIISSRVTLGASVYGYTGENITPSVLVKNSNGTAICNWRKSSNYCVKITYEKSRSKVGTYEVTIKGVGNYTGTVVKTYKVMYKVKYVLNGGTNSSSNPTYYKGTLKLSKPTRMFYSFVGWYTNKSCTNKVTSIKNCNKTLYAKWKKKSLSQCSYKERMYILRSRIIKYGFKNAAGGYTLNM